MDKKRAPFTSMQPLPILKDAALAVAIFICIYGAALYLPGTKGYAWYPIKTIECGHKPFMTWHLFGERTYYQPAGPSIFTVPSVLHCTEQELQSAGYRYQT